MASRTSKPQSWAESAERKPYFRDTGGVLPDTTNTGMPMGQAPTGSTLQTLKGLPAETLREMAVQHQGSQMGDLVSRALNQKQILSGQQSSQATDVARGAASTPQVASGGIIPHRAMGGADLESMSMADPTWIRQMSHGVLSSQNPMGGRTDTIPHSVAADSYVIPADVVSGLGEGDTMSGAKWLDRMFKSLPYGQSRLPQYRHSNLPGNSREGLQLQQEKDRMNAQQSEKNQANLGKSMGSLFGGADPYAGDPGAGKSAGAAIAGNNLTSGSTIDAPTVPSKPGVPSSVLNDPTFSQVTQDSPSWLSQAGSYLSNLFADGGAVGLADGGEAPAKVPVIVAPGEYLVHPKYIAQLGDGDVKKGHEVLEHFVKKARKKHIQDTKALPGPVR